MLSLHAPKKNTSFLDETVHVLQHLHTQQFLTTFNENVALKFITIYNPETVKIVRLNRFFNDEK